MAVVDEYSVCPLHIAMMFGEIEISQGSAFIWKTDDNEHFLITNWHNLSGKNPSTGKHLSPTGAEPDRIKIAFRKKDNIDTRLFKVVNIRDEQGAPLWYIHPERGCAVDVVALGISIDADADAWPLNLASSADLQLRIGFDVFVIGFPFGIGPDGFPVWKRGSLASEPEVAEENGNQFFVDTASRPGMSGAPVIRRSWSTHLMRNGNTLIDGREKSRFIGVYSGRLAASDPLDAQLGLVWPARLVTEVLSGKKRDT